MAGKDLAERVTSKLITWNTEGRELKPTEGNRNGPKAGVFLQCSRNHKESGVTQENCIRE